MNEMASSSSEPFVYLSCNLICDTFIDERQSNIICKFNVDPKRCSNGEQNKKIKYINVTPIVTYTLQILMKYSSKILKILKIMKRLKRLSGIVGSMLAQFFAHFTQTSLMKKIGIYFHSVH
uniref:Uncharacterized protein n=1 Tax=Heterorhabditis bacteriophora TaxID=37862 RepID=A0A1I7X844_HETBA